jgi:succinate dehydrogenase / fumarate reductase flavoprotein subunit
VSGDYQSKLTLMSESLRNDGRIWVPKDKDDKRAPNQIPEAERDYYLERIYPSFANLVPRDVASRAAKRMVDDGYGVGPLKNGVYLDFKTAIERLGRNVIEQRYGNLFDMYANISGEDPYQVPMRIYPAVHYTMGGLWVDYNLMSNLPGLFVVGEANFSDHGANRLGASALMQGLADGYFILPTTIAGELAGQLNKPAPSTDSSAFKEAEDSVRERTNKFLGIKGSRSVDSFHKELGKLMWEYCGMARNAAGLKHAREAIGKLREEFWRDVKVLGEGESFNQSLEKAGRVADFFELAELMCQDALEREESCGGHFREEHQTPEGEAQRDDDNFAYVAAWEFNGPGKDATLHKEDLVFENVHLAQRSYK